MTRILQNVIYQRANLAIRLLSLARRDITNIRLINLQFDQFFYNLFYCNITIIDACLASTFNVNMTISTKYRDLVTIGINNAIFFTEVAFSISRKTVSNPFKSELIQQG